MRLFLVYTQQDDENSNVGFNPHQMHSLRRFVPPPLHTHSEAQVIMSARPQKTGGLDTSVTKSVLHQAFVPFGEIIEVNLPSSSSGAANPDNRGNDLDNDSGSTKHRGFGYVEFESQEDAVAAIDNMDQAMLAGRVLTVAPAKPQKDVGNILGSKVAVWEQVRFPSLASSSTSWVRADVGRRKTGSGSTRCRRKTGSRRSRPRPRRWLRQLPTPCRGWRGSMWPGRSLRPSRARQARCSMVAVAVPALQGMSTDSLTIGQ